MAAMHCATFKGPGGYTFRAYGRTPEAARYALAMAWQIHAREQGASAAYLLRFANEIRTEKVEAGQAWRNEERIR